MTRHAITWFEIPVQNLDRAQAFYEGLLAISMRREAMGPSQGAVFPYSPHEQGVGGALLCGPSAPLQSAGGTLVYLDASPSLDMALQRAEALGGKVALTRQALPPGMGFFAHITDPEGNRVGLHAEA